LKHFISFLVCLFCYQYISAQADTEVYLFDISVDNDTVILSNKINISSNAGYDNQPSFFDNNTVLFSSTRNGQTDIRKYDIATDETTWLTNTSVGSEYSPTRIENGDQISAVRLDTTGLQLLYAYDIEKDYSRPILKDAKVGYHLWYNKDVLVNTVLIENRMDLVVSNLKDGTNYTFQKNVGRCLQKIPNSKNISFVQREGNQNVIKSLDPITGKTDSITNISNIQDYAWHPLGFAVIGMKNTLMIFDSKEPNQWATLYQSQDKNVQKITRLAISPNGDKIAIVSEVSHQSLIDKQFESFNKRDLDAFVSCFSEDVVVSNFPGKTLFTGIENLRKDYQNYFDNDSETKVDVVSRIIVGDVVIDKELVLNSSSKKKQAAIYKIQNGKIKSMTMVYGKGNEKEAEQIVDEQLVAYNSRNIDAFLETYSEDVELFSFPNNQTSKGQEAIRQGYEGFFDAPPDLNCEIKNRIIIGNKVIDQEHITANGGSFEAIAIYEIENGKIAKVTFVQ